MERLYGKYEPISKETQKVIDDLYEKYGQNTEKKQRLIAYDVSSDQKVINQDMLFAGANAINESYMLRNTHKVELSNGETIKSLKLRDFKDDEVENKLKSLLADGLVEIEVVSRNVKPNDIDKRDNFTLDNPVLYRIRSGKYEGLCFSTGVKENKDGSKQDALFIDIANTPFDKLTKGWQESNFDPFEFAYKLVKNYPNLDDEEYAAVVHVYWLTGNQWAIESNNPMGVPYQELDRIEQVKDGDNVLVADIFKKEEEKIGTENLNKEKCLDIVRIAKEMLSGKLAKEAKEFKTTEEK